MPVVYAALIRHGDYQQKLGAPSAHQPYGLTDQGHAQAEAAAGQVVTLARKLGAVIHPRIYCSNLLRGWQTADILRGQLGLAEPVQGLDDLAERGLGSAANLTIDEIADIMSADPRFEEPPSDWKSNSHYRLPLQGAESLMQAGERVARCLATTVNDVVATAKDDCLVLFVGHGAAFRHAAHHLGVLDFDDIAKLSMHHAKPVILRAAGGLPWAHAGGDWKVRKTSEEAMD